MNFPVREKKTPVFKQALKFIGLRFINNFRVHVRRTFSTVVALANNVSLENVAKMLGHTSTKMTQRYAKVLDRSILRDMQGVKKSFSLNLSRLLI